MKTLIDLCKPRESVFDETRRDDVLDLTNLIENSINPKEFFEENFVTEGMKLLFDVAFKRFHRQGATGIVKLTQAMGGGKTHNMIALGLLAKHPEHRTQLLGNEFRDSYVGKVKVVGFTGRESDAPYGIWGSIAEQLGKKEVFKDYYSPLRAPGQKAWIDLLKGEPLLILLDELAPYLENAKSVSVGDSNLAVVTTTALANLFTAVNKEELSNVLVVVSDLKATYESGSELLQSAFRELDSEINRSALHIEPVGSTSDEMYHILKKRLFEQLPSDDEIVEIANAYKQAVMEARQMGYTNMSPDKIFLGVRNSYPFHPSIRDLYARFKENEGFQQTRGLIRLMRRIVAQLYSGENPKAAEKYLINAHDFDLRDPDMLTAIVQIKPSLSNAIAHDICSNGKAIAEVVDGELGGETMQEVAKLILVASLADVPNAVLGLSLQDIVGYLCEPNKDITGVKRALEDFLMQAWYLYTDKDGKIFFKNTRNMIAELNSLVDSYDNESAKKELRTYLVKLFKPILADCYQDVEVFPALDEITLIADKVLLVLAEPTRTGVGLHPELKRFYDNARYKNRVMFLSGERNTMEKILLSAKQGKAMNTIIERMKEERVSENDPQYQKADDKHRKIELELLQAARETFCTLYYPTGHGLLKADFLMEFRSNDYNGEKQIRDLLLIRQKFTEDVTGDIFRKKCEERLFTQKEMRWSDVKERAATNPEWQWHIPRALDDLKDEMLRKGIWREHGGYIEKGPFPKEKTDVLIQELRRDDETGEVVLKLTPKCGDKIYYEVDRPPTTASSLVEVPNEFRTDKLRLYFLCVDSTGEHETGEPREWRNKITLKYRMYDNSNNRAVELKAAPSAKILYTTDGSNPREYGLVYNSEIIVPPDARYVLAIADADGVSSSPLQIKVDAFPTAHLGIDTKRSLTLKKRYKTDGTASTYEELELLKKHQAQISGIVLTLHGKGDEDNKDGWIEIVTDHNRRLDVDKVEDLIDHIRDTFMRDRSVDITFEYKIAMFESGQRFLDWVADGKKSLKDFREEEIVQ